MDETYTLITGAASGFGRSIAQKLASSRKLLLTDINAERLEATRKSCANPERHLMWVRDLNRLEGIGEDLTSFLTTTNAHVNRLFNINVFSAMEIIRPLAQKRVNKGMLRSITFISALGSRVGGKGYFVYAASKGAVNAMSLSLAVELAPNVRVNAVLPGTIETEMSKDYFADPDFVASVRAVHPLGLGRAEDVADAVEFLSSDRARWITGQELVVDGGRFASKTPST